MLLLVKVDQCSDKYQLMWSQCVIYISEVNKCYRRKNNSENIDFYKIIWEDISPLLLIFKVVCQPFAKRHNSTRKVSHPSGKSNLVIFILKNTQLFGKHSGLILEKGWRWDCMELAPLSEEGGFTSQCLNSKNLWHFQSWLEIGLSVFALDQLTAINSLW